MFDFGGGGVVGFGGVVGGVVVVEGLGGFVERLRRVLEGFCEGVRLRWEVGVRRVLLQRSRKRLRDVSDMVGVGH